MKNWHKLKTIVKIHSKWLTLFGESWTDEHDNELEYWRIEKADSVIILPIWNHSIILPPKNFRVGVNTCTLDFPGGRIEESKKHQEMVTKILERELGVNSETIYTIKPQNQEGWLINSSFSNQKLYGFVAEIADDSSIPKERIGSIFPNTRDGIQTLLGKLNCLQCRAVLLEWLRFQDTNLLK
ncbi:hydrolase, NUDIX [Candidatus Thiomargarita nelsonii]|uniref:Hydrolase, NUDIX n=1 Tax=Candidatus Thiomargarita nelsonii TaxID=1003181 RepID=A0A0A6NZJ8_9GAMM|nr:hydrolase, NUDIX [Candidatus Thiomargarita nelsonii]